eukprot:GHRR01000400.1.p1 GENE.GHRR01000400.1~~GHRR01000400.1.p1  ORF type:complete len:920 (+),score=392.79 GHRR01000400.1:268-3027(+)
MFPNAYLSSSPALLASSPPAKSSSLPIKPLSKSVPSRQDVDLPRRPSVSDGEQQHTRKLSFNKTPFAGSLTSTPVASAGRPPAVPSAVRGQVCVGFAVDSTPQLSPGRLQTKSSLLSQALLEPSLSNELFGSAAPSSAFQGLMVLPDKPLASPPVDSIGLLELQAKHPVFSSSTVAAAYSLAASAHAGQVRKSGEPVLAHCTATGLILAELGLPEDVVAAGLLHDVLCDTPVQQWQLAVDMPASVVSLVAKVSQLNQLSQLYRDNTHSLEAEAMLDMLTGMDDVSALLIKLTDRLHNMRTISALSRCKQVRMASETLDVFAVLANRLGAWSIKAELEDLSFKTLNPEEYQLVADAIKQRTGAAAAAAAGTGSSSPTGLSAGIDTVTNALTAAGLEVVDVSGRVKNVYGVWKKVQKHLNGSRDMFSGSSFSSSDSDEPSSPVSPATAATAGAAVAGGPEDISRAHALAAAVAEVYDIQALRVVVPHKHDCYAAMRVVQQLWTPLPGRVKDYIRNRKPNGYQSLHLTVRDASGHPLEVQVRTPKMHYIAEYGFAAHWKYKERLGRQDLWLDRLVQWKKWVTTEKLGIVDKKLRPSGSPGGSGGDAALADLAKRLALEAAVAGGASSSNAAVTNSMAASAVTATAAAAAVPVAGLSPGDAVAAELLALEGASAAVVAIGMGSSSVGSSAVPADEKFAARFRMQPISDSEMGQHGASVVITGPKGVQIRQLPAGCTVRQLLDSGELTRQSSLQYSSQYSDISSTKDALASVAAMGHSNKLLSGLPGLGLDAARSSSSSMCRVAVNGVVVLPGQANQVALRNGDQLQLLEDPPLLPLLGLVMAGGGGNVDEVFATAAAASRPQQQQHSLQRAPGGGLSLPGLLAEAGESLSLFVRGACEPMELALQQKLTVAPRVPEHAAALVS